VRCRLPALLFLLAVFARPLHGQNGDQPFTTEDVLNVARISVQDITSDGSHIAAIRWTDRDRKNVDHMRFGDPTYISPSLGELIVIDGRSGSITRVFDELVQSRGATWSPDGTSLTFFRLEGDQYRLYTFDPMRNRATRVNIRTDKQISSGSTLEWRPDGSGVLLELRQTGWAMQAREAYRALTFGPTIVQDSREEFLAWDIVRGLGNLSIPAIVNLASREVREVLPEARYSGFTQSDDGRLLSYTAVTPLRTAYERGEGTEYETLTLDLSSGETRSLSAKSEDRVNPTWNNTGNVFAYGHEGNVFVRDVSAGDARNLTEQHRASIAEDDSTRLRYSVTQWRPDGTALLVESQRGYHLLDVDSGTIELVYPFPEGEDEGPRLSVTHWSQDGNSLFMTYSARDRWERGLVRYDIPEGRTIDLIKDQNLYDDWEFTENGDRVFYSMSDGDMPDDLYVADAAFRSATRLTQLNPWLESRAMTRSELVEYLDVDGNTLYGIVYYPVNYEPGRTYPLVAEIYEDFFDNGYNHRMNLLANAGFFGFRPSAELETGFPGEGWLKGVTAGINKLIERGLVDPEKLGVHGTSYGGYATNLLITQTDRFAAAINISGKVNIISFLGDSPKITTRNYRAAEDGQDRIGATLWEQPQKYVAHSAIMFADRIETPLLMLTGEGDWNVPATNQREMYYALRRLGKEVVWVHYMNAGHGAGRSSTVEDFHDHWNRIIGWYNEHFAGDEAPAVSTDSQGRQR